jgi:TrmH family RNA methyltransferase
MITSTKNSKIQQIRALQGRTKERQDADAFLLEGVRLVEETQQVHWPLQTVIYTAGLSERGMRLLHEIQNQTVDIEEVTPEVMQSACGTETPQGILAVARLPHPEPPQDLSFIPVLDGIRDPGNVGTLMRAAAAAGARDMLLAPGTADPFAPKVVRSAMGAHFRLNLHPLPWGEIEDLLHTREEGQPQILLADVRGGVPYWQADLKRATALIISNEAEGASIGAQQLADGLIHIPMPGGFESLNAASAGSILFFEVVRQRQ